MALLANAPAPIFLTMKARRRRLHVADPNQLSLGLGPPQRCGLFFAVMPPDSAVVHIRGLADELRRRFGLRSTPRIPHVSVYGLGAYDHNVAKDVIAAAGKAARLVRVGSFEAIFDGVQAFAGPNRPLVLRCGKGLHGFVALQNAIGNALSGAGADRIHLVSRFAPHLTLLYGGEKMPQMTLDAPIGWRVDGSELILSLQGYRQYKSCGR